MAMNPAAKDPNSFASATLGNGNSATGAILGLQQNQSLPRGPQPTAIPQGMPGGVPNFFASASGGQPPQPAGLTVSGSDEFDQTHAQNQQVIAQMFAPQAPSEPVYGLGPNGELQVGNQVAPMQDNPTSAAMLIQSPAGQQPTKLRPGFNPVRASEVNQFLAGINHGAMSNLYQGGKEFVTRAPGAILNAAGDAAKWGGADTVGTGLKNLGEGWDYGTGADQPVDTLGRGTVGKWFVNSAADASLMLPIIATTMALPETALPKALSYLGDAALNFGLFGGQSAQVKKEQLIAQGVDPAEANKAGWVDFFTQGGGMMAMGAGGRMAGNTYGAAQQIVSKLQQAVGKGAITAEQAAAAVVNPALLARFAANTAGNIGVQGAAMSGMAGASAASNNAYGGEHQDVGDAMAGGLGAGLSFGALMSPMGLAHQFKDSGRRAQLGAALADARNPVDLLGVDRGVEAAKQIQPDVAQFVGEQPAQQWRNDVQSQGNMSLMEHNARQWQEKQAQAAQAAADAQAKAVQEAAGVQETAAKDQAKADRAAHEQKVSVTMNTLGVTNKKARAVISGAVKDGVDVTQIPGIDNLLQTAEGRKQAQALIDQQKGTPSDSIPRPAGTVTTDVGGPRGVEPEGSVGAGVPKPADAAGGTGHGTVEPPAGVRKPVVSRVASEPAKPVAEPVKLKESDIPDFNLEPTTGTPNANWLDEHPVEGETTHPVTDYKVTKEQATLDLPEQRTAGKLKLKPAPKVEAKVEAPVLTAEHAWNRMKTGGMGKYADLPPEVRAIVDEQHKQGRVTQQHWDESQKSAKETAAKQSRKRQETDTAVEAAKTPEEKAAEVEEKSTLPSEDLLKVVFGNVAGRRIWAAANGEGWVDIATREGVDQTTPQKMVKRLTDKAVDKAVDAGKLPPTLAQGVKDALTIAKGGTVQRKMKAEIAKEGGDSTAHNTDLTEDQAKDLLTTDGVHVTGADSMGVKAGTEAKEGRSTTLSKREETITQRAIEKEVEIKAALKAGDKAKASKLREELKALNLEFMEGKAEPTKTSERASPEDVDSRIETLNYELSDAEEADNTKAIERIQKEIQALKDERDSEDAAPKGGPDKYESDDLTETGGRYGDFLDISKKGEALARQGYEKSDVPRVQAGLTLKRLLDKLSDGRVSDGEFVFRVGELARKLADITRIKEANSYVGDRVRGADRALEVLLAARRRGEINPEMVDFAKWLIDGNPHLVEDLALSLKQPGVNTPAGRYNPVARVATIFKDAGNSGTAVHEILHHTERMMPEAIQKEIAKEWAEKFEAAMKKATPEERTALTDMLNSVAGDKAAYTRLAESFKKGTLDYDKHYQLVNPSEYWAVNGTRILQGRHEATTWQAKARQWLSEFVQHIKSAFGLQSDAAILKALENVTTGDGKFQTKRMIGDAEQFHDIQRNIAKLPEKLQEPTRNVVDSLQRWGSHTLQHVTFTRDLVKQGVAEGMHSLSRYEKLREQQAAMSGHFRKLSVDAIEDVRNFKHPEHKAMSDFLQHSTLSGDWGYGPKATGNAKKMFDDLTPRAQKVAKAVFAHGEEMLKAKQDAINQLTNDTYGEMMAEAKAANKTSVYNELKAERDAMTKKYASLMRLVEGKPYTSARRQGDWVVVGKSKEFLKAEQDAKSEDVAAAKRGNEARMEMQDKAEHYLVHEAQNPAEARELIKNMRSMGFPEGVDNTYYHAKDKWKASLEGGTGVLMGMGRLRSQLDELYKDARTPEDKAKYETSRKLLSAMWLDALGSASARKSELRRLGIKGEMDMVRAFRLQSTADAHFISGIHHNAKMLDALKAANKEVFKGNADNAQLNRKQSLYDEFMRRHDLSLNAPPTEMFNKITQVTALWQIATSPAHYLGNLMQPWAMTLPYLQARHGYANSAKEFSKAYSEIGDILVKTGILNSLKVSDMPADVRAAMSRLLELGRLDIGMNTEYGSLELGERGAVTKAAQAAADRIRQASLKLESLNRLASAAAAYRLEMARTGDHEASLHYAADVVAETHGDFSSTNAPRMFNTGLGKMALQFRKFQLVQMTYMAKMLGNLKNADPAERAIAAKALAYTLAHVGVLGGALAMPGFATMSAASSALGKAMTGVAGQDWETLIDKAAGDRDLAQLILRGIPGALGVDITRRVGFGDMLSVTPMSTVDPTSAQSVKETLGDVLSGPFGGLLERSATALGHIYKGNYHKGLEGMLPAGVANVMKAERTMREGVTNTKNDKMMDVGAANAFVQALGFTPSKQAIQSAETGAMIKSTTDFKDRLELLKTKYTNAVRSGGDTASAIKNMNELRTQMQERGFRPTPLGTMLKAPTEQLIREIFTTEGGVQYRPGQSQRATDQFAK